MLATDDICGAKPQPLYNKPCRCLHEGDPVEEIKGSKPKKWTWLYVLSLFFQQIPMLHLMFLIWNFPKYCWAPNSLIWFHSVWHGLISSSSSVISLHQSVIFLHLQQKFLWVAWLSGVSKLLRLLQAEIGLLGTQQWLVGYWYWEETQGICSSERIQSTGTSIPNWNCWDSRNEYDILLVTLMNEQTNKPPQHTWHPPWHPLMDSHI